MKRYTSVVGALAGAAVLAMAAGSASAADKTISAINFSPANTFYGKPLRDYVDLVNKAGKGLKIDVKPFGSIGMFEIGNAVKNGVVDLANLPPTFMSNIAPVAEIIKLSTKPMSELNKNGTWDLMNKVLNEQANMELIQAWGDGVQFHIYLRDKKIASPDLTGLKMRVTPLYTAGFQKMGASTVQIPFNELYTALERKVIDGYGITLSNIVTWGWSKFTKYRVDPGFYEVWSAFVINKKTWDGLSPAHQAVLKDAGKKMYDIVHARVPKQNAQDMKEQKDAGMQVIKFTGANAKKLHSAMYDSAWDEMMKKAPKYAPQFRKLITN